jgi:hypothetical protein
MQEIVHVRLYCKHSCTASFRRSRCVYMLTQQKYRLNLDNNKQFFARTFEIEMKREIDWRKLSHLNEFLDSVLLPFRWNVERDQTAARLNWHQVGTTGFA